MKNMKLNQAEMASIYGGVHAMQEFEVGDDVCMKECGACHPKQPQAKEEYKKNMIRIDREFGR